MLPSFCLIAVPFQLQNISVEGSQSVREETALFSQTISDLDPGLKLFSDHISPDLHIGQLYFCVALVSTTLITISSWQNKRAFRH